MTPAQLLGQHLADARRHGECFADAWPAAVEVALDGQRRGELSAWRAALDETGYAWEAGWDRREATAAQRALLTVAEDLAVAA